MMPDSIYESHRYPDTKLPILLHRHHESRNFLPNRHENMEFLHILHGSGAVQVDGVPISVEAGDIVLVPSLSIHSVAKGSPLLLYDCLIIDRAFCEENGFPSPVGAPCSPFRCAALVEAFERVISEYDTEGPLRQAGVRTALLSFLLTLYRQGIPESPFSLPLSDSRLEIAKNALTFLRAHYSEPISTAQVGDCIGVSLSHLCRAFHQGTGMTVLEYLNRLRCAQAHRMLLEGKDSVSAIAAAVGYENLSYFSRMYRRFHGHLPSETRKRAF